MNQPTNQEDEKTVEGYLGICKERGAKIDQNVEHLCYIHDNKAIVFDALRDQYKEKEHEYALYCYGNHNMARGLSSLHRLAAMQLLSREKAKHNTPDLQGFW